MMNIKTYWALLKESSALWTRHNTAMLASSLAYYAIFSLIPLLVLVLMIVQRFFGDQLVEEQILAQLQETEDSAPVHILQLMIISVEDTLPGVFTAAIGLGTLLFGASHIFTQFKDALNIIWEVQAKPRYGIRNFLWTQLIAITIVPGIVLLLVASLFIDVWLASLTEPLTDLLPGIAGVYTLRILKSLLAFVILTLVLALVYKLLPDVEIAWRDVWAGAALTALLLTLGQFGIGAYLAWSDLESIYGVAGWIMFVLIWVYLSAQILLFGAEFTEVYALRSGSRFVPSPYAKPRSKDSPLAQAMEQTTPKQSPPK